MALFPGALPAAGTANSTDTLAVAGHTSLHNTVNDEVRAVATKIGTGASTPTATTALTGTGAGTSSWSQVNLTTMVTGVLPAANGGTGVTTSTGSGSVVLSTSPTIVTPTLTTPTIADLTNATHDHTSSAEGGSLGVNTVGTSNITDGSVTPSKLDLDPVSAVVTTGETTTSTTYTDLSTTTDTVSVTIGANGFAMVSIYGSIALNAQSSIGYISFVMSGANTQAAADSFSLQYTTPPSGANFNGAFGATFLLSGLVAGVTTFKLKYKVNANTGTFSDRRIAVVVL